MCTRREVGSRDLQENGVENGVDGWMGIVLCNLFIKKIRWIESSCCLSLKVAINF